MIVVSDTSCVSNLLTIGQGHLLAALFGEVVVPPAVKVELERFHSALPGFLRLVTPVNRDHVERLLKELDDGEAEAICVACELRADRLLIDEKAGRLVAEREGIPVIGLVGVLVSARKRGLIGALRPLLEHLETEAGFRLSETIRRTALMDVGENYEA